MVLTVSAKSVCKKFRRFFGLWIYFDISGSTDIKFLRAGGEFIIAEKRLIKELGLGGHVQYAGSPRPTKISPIYQLADAFPSRRSMKALNKLP